jgi:hypothetical protein
VRGAIAGLNCGGRGDCPLPREAGRKVARSIKRQKSNWSKDNREEIMKTSTDRIITTHAGSLPRPPDLLALIRAKLAGQPCDESALAAEITRSVEAATKQQADIGLDVISDGEMPKPSFLSYINDRLGGVTITAEPFGDPWKGSRENKSFPEYYAWEASLNLNPAVGAKRVICDGPLTYKGHRQSRPTLPPSRRRWPKSAYAKLSCRRFRPPTSSSGSGTSTTSRTRNTSSHWPMRCTRNTRRSPTPACCCRSTIRGWSRNT